MKGAHRGEGGLDASPTTSAQDLAAEVHRLRAGMDALMVRFVSLQQEAAAAKAKVSVQESAIERLVAASARKGEEDPSTAGLSRQVAQSVVVAQDREIADLKGTLRARDAEVERLREELTALHSDLRNRDATQHRKDTEASRLQVTVQSARDALQKADESRLSLQFKCGELSVALEDITQEKNRLHGLLQAEREENARLRASESRLAGRVDAAEDAARVAILRHKDVCASMEGLQALCASQQSELHANATKLRDHERNARECEQLIADIRGELDQERRTIVCTAQEAYDKLLTLASNVHAAPPTASSPPEPSGSRSAVVEVTRVLNACSSFEAQLRGFGDLTSAKVQDAGIQLERVSRELASERHTAHRLRDELEAKARQVSELSEAASRHHEQTHRVVTASTEQLTVIQSTLLEVERCFVSGSGARSPSPSRTSGRDSHQLDGVVDACRLLALRAQRCKEVVLRGAAALRDELTRVSTELDSQCRAKASSASDVTRLESQVSLLSSQLTVLSKELTSSAVQGAVESPSRASRSQHGPSDSMLASSVLAASEAALARSHTAVDLFQQLRSTRQEFESAMLQTEQRHALEVQRLREALTAKEEDTAALHSQVASLRRQLEASAKDIAALAVQSPPRPDPSVSQSEDVIRMSQDVTSLAEQMKAQRKALNGKISALESALAASERKLYESAAEFAEEKSSLEAHATSLRQQIEAMAKEITTLAAGAVTTSRGLSSSASPRRGKGAAADEEYIAMSQQLIKLAEDARTQKQSLQAQVATLESQQSALRQELALASEALTTSQSLLQTQQRMYQELVVEVTEAVSSSSVSKTAASSSTQSPVRHADGADGRTQGHQAKVLCAQIAQLRHDMEARIMGLAQSKDELEHTLESARDQHTQEQDSLFQELAALTTVLESVQRELADALQALPQHMQASRGSDGDSAPSVSDLSRAAARAIDTLTHHFLAAGDELKESREQHASLQASFEQLRMDFQSETQQLREDLQLLSSQLEEYEQHVAELEGAKAGLSEAMEKQAAESEEKLRQASLDTDAAHNENVQLRDQLSSSSSQLQRLHDALEDADDVRTKLEAEVAAGNADVTSFLEKLERECDTFTLQDHQVDSDSDADAASEGRLHWALLLFRSLSRARDDLQARARELTTRVSAMAEASIQSSEAVQRLQHHLDDSIAARESLTGDLERVCGDLAERDADLLAARATTQRLEDELQASKSETANVSERLEGAEAQRGDLMRELEDAKAAIVEADDLQSRLREDVANAQEAHAQLHAANEMLRTQLSITSSQLAQASETLSSTKSSLASSQREVDSCRDRITVLEADVSIARAEASSAQSSASELANRLAESTRQVAAGDAQCEQLRHRVADLEASVAAAASDLRSVRRDLTSAEERLQGSEESKRQLKLELDAARGRVSTLEHTTQGQAADLGDCRLQLSRALMELETSNTQRDKEANSARRVKAELAALQELQDAAKQEMDTLRHYQEHYQEMQELAVQARQDADDRQHTIDKLTADVERIGAQLVQVESEMTDLMERHSKEVDALMASSKSREDDHLKEKKYLELQAALVQQALDSEREVFKGSQATVEALSRQILDIREQVSLKESTIVTLSSELRHLRGRSGDDAVADDDRIRRLTDQVQRLTAHNEKLSKVNASLDKKLKVFTSEVMKTAASPPPPLARGSGRASLGAGASLGRGGPVPVPRPLQSRPSRSPSPKGRTSPISSPARALGSVVGPGDHAAQDAQALRRRSTSAVNLRSTSTTTSTLTSTRTVSASNAEATTGRASLGGSPSVRTVAVTVERPGDSVDWRTERRKLLDGSRRLLQTNEVLLQRNAELMDALASTAAEH